MVPLLALPFAAFDLVRATAGRAVEAAAAFSTVPIRVFQVLSATEMLVNRITVLTDRAETLLTRTGTVVGHAEDTVSRTDTVIIAATAAVREAAAVATAAATIINDAARVSDSAETAVKRVTATADEAAGLLDAYAPALRTAAPLANDFIRHLSQEEVTAAIRLIDQLPRLLDHLNTDVLPLLATLERVGPDVHALLETTRDLKLAVAGIPGIRLLKRRGEEKENDDEF